jgi:signal transduction histidine kinase
LRYMRQRADLIGATISWRANEADKGTVVEIGVDLAGRGSGSSSDH